MDRIVLTRGTDGWNATWEGECGADILRHFGTRTIPTAYTLGTRGDKVVEKLRDLNKGIEVVLG